MPANDLTARTPGVTTHHAQVVLHQKKCWGFCSTAHNARNAMPRAATQSHDSVMIPFTGSPVLPWMCKSRASGLPAELAAQER